MSIRDYADVLVSCVEHLFPKQSPQSHGHLFVASVCMSMSNYSVDDGANTVVATLHLAVQAESNYVSVFAAASRVQPVWHDLKWALVARHDSAWRDDGIRAALRDAHAELTKLAAERLACEPKDLSEHLSLAFIGPVATAELLGSLKPAEIGRGKPDIATATL